MAVIEALAGAVRPRVSQTIAQDRWINPMPTAEAPREHFVVKRSQASQIGSMALDKYFDGVDPNNCVFSKSSTPHTSLSQSTMPKLAKALRFLKL